MFCKPMHNCFLHFKVGGLVEAGASDHSSGDRDCLGGGGFTVSWKTDHHPLQESQHSTHRPQLDWTQLRQQPLLTTVLLVVKGPLDGWEQQWAACLWNWLCVGNAPREGINQNTGEMLLSKLESAENLLQQFSFFSRALTSHNLCQCKIKRNHCSLTVLVTCRGMCHIQSQLYCSLLIYCAEGQWGGRASFSIIP